MRRIGNQGPKGISRQAIRIWGTLCLIAGVVGQGIIMNVLLGMQGKGSAEIIDSLEASQNNLTLGIIALLLQMAYACAIPIFTFLLVDGFSRTSSVKNYILRMAGLAVLTEIPYNLAMSGMWFDFNSRNPMVAMVLGMVMMYIYRYYAGKKIKNILIRVMVFALSIIWIEMLRIDHGVAIVVMISTLWALRKNRSWQILGGCAMMFVVGVFPSYNPSYWLAPILFLVVHFYNDEPCDENRWVNYLTYPAIMLVVGLIAQYAL